VLYEHFNIKDFSFLLIFSHLSRLTVAELRPDCILLCAGAICSLLCFVLPYIFLYCHQQQNYLSIHWSAFTIYTPARYCYYLKGSVTVTQSQSESPSQSRFRSHSLSQFAPIQRISRTFVCRWKLLRLQLGNCVMMLGLGMDLEMGLSLHLL